MLRAARLGHFGCIGEMLFVERAWEADLYIEGVGWGARHRAAGLGSRAFDPETLIAKQTREPDLFTKGGESLYLGRESIFWERVYT
jgi:hypothetical protein